MKSRTNIFGRNLDAEAEVEIRRLLPQQACEFII